MGDANRKARRAAQYAVSGSLKVWGLSSPLKSMRAPVSTRKENGKVTAPGEASALAREQRKLDL